MCVCGLVSVVWSESRWFLLNNAPALVGGRVRQGMVVLGRPGWSGEEAAAWGRSGLMDQREETP